MALFGASIEIHTNNLLAHVIGMISDARSPETVYLVSPYLQLNTNVRDVIEDATGKGVQIRLIYRAGEKLRDEDRKYLANSNVQLRALPHLHAKLYVCETAALVTSLNLYNYSDKESREIGILFTDFKSISSLKETALQWWDKADKVDRTTLLMEATGSDSKSKAGDQGAKTTGFCIRCHDPKTFNPKYPYCDSCYKDWVKSKDETKAEKFCHRCGDKNSASVKFPLCKPCWSATNK